MNEDLQRWLDGELATEDLGAAAQEDAEAWERLIDAFRVDQPAGSAPSWLESRVMAEIEALPAPGVLRRAVDWFLRPHAVRISPMTVGLAAAAVAMLTLLPAESPLRESPHAPGTPAVIEASREAMVVVEFRVEATGARSVAIAGDFTGWRADQEMEDLNGDGVWTGRVAIRPGVYAYMFVIDGSEWIADPNAERYLDDGFGKQNAVLAVTTPSA